VEGPVSEEVSAISTDALPEICPPAETGLQRVSDGSPEREQVPSLPSGEIVERPSSVQVLSRLASTARLFRSSDGRFCAQVPAGDRFEITSLNRRLFAIG
jgi:hypothetical protein